MTHLREVNSEAPAQTTGQVLRSARERRGGDLQTAANALRIRKDHLEALEQDRIEALPGRTYALGFIRAYAGYLGLDPGSCIERFKQETAGRSDSAPQIGFASEPEPLMLPYGRIFAIALIALIVLYGAYYLFRPIATHSSQPVAAVPAGIVLATAGHNRPQTTQPLRSKPVVQPAGNTSTNPGGTAATSGNSATLASLDKLPAGQTLGMQNKNVRVILHARAVSHLLVQGGGGKVYLNRILHPGDAYRVPNLVGLLLTTPDGGAVSLELDGQNMGLAGRPGQMTEALSLDPQAIVDRSNAAKHG